MAAHDIQLPSTARDLTPAGLIAVAWVGFTVAASLVALRCYARLAVLHRIYADDYWLFAALFFLLANAILQTLQTPSTYYLGWLEAGRKAPPEQIDDIGNLYVRYEFVIIGLFWSIIWCVKASFLSMYWRLFEDLPHYLRLWWVVSIFTACAYIGCWVASAWTCHPPSSYFHFGQCEKPVDLRGGVISISYSTAVDILSDLMIMLLPIRILPSLQVNRAQKQGLALIFCVGFLVIAAALVRLSQIVTTQRSDPAGLAVWSLVESSISVIVGTLPALKSLMTRGVQNTFRSTPSGSRSTQFGGSKSRRRNTSSDEDSHELFKMHEAAGTTPLGGCSVSAPFSNSPEIVRGQIVVEREFFIH